MPSPAPQEWFTPSTMAAVVSLAIAFLALLSQLRNYRALSQARFRNIDERAKAVAFWSDWVDAQAKVNDPVEMTALRQMAREKLMEIATEPTAREGQQMSLLRETFLLRLPRRAWTWAPQSLFYVLAILGLGYIVGGAFDLSADRTPERIALYLGASVLMIVLAAIMRMFALLADTSRTARPPQGDLG
jgi:hypothetical protein